MTAATIRRAPAFLRRGLELRTGRLRADRAFAAAARGDRPILVGPFLSEIGFEVLYWLPMLARYFERHAIAKERVVAMSRGGAGVWYADLTAGYVDVFDHLTPAKLKETQRRRVERAGTQKQFAVSELDERLLDLARRDTGVGADAAVLHPSLMYNAFTYVWADNAVTYHGAERAGHHGARRRLLHRPLPRPPANDDPALDLPAEYVAVKAYFSDCFPDNEDNRQFIARLVARLTEAHPVVLLSTGIDLDDHRDFTRAAEEGGVWTVEHVMTPRNNLEVQTRAIAGAKALVTTYGGFSYLGPFLGVPSIAFYSVENFVPAHLDVMRRAVTDLRNQGAGAGFMVVDVRDYPLVELAAGLVPEAPAT
jgi:hypothetical protein